jgi:hypothetical protein
MARKYSVSEIERMRNAVRLMVPDRADAGLRVLEIEERLRTYIANGTEPEELELETAAQRIVEASQLRTAAGGG